MATSRIHRRVGLSTSAVPHPDPSVFDLFARAGIECAELSLPGAEYPTFPYAQAARRARDAGVEIRSFHLPFYTDETVDPAALDPAVRRRTAEIHAHCLRLAADMGASVAVVHAGLEPVGDAERAERLAYSKESMAVLAELGASLGLTVCVEDLPRSCLGNTSAELADIIAADPRLRVCFDVNHLLKESHADFLRALGPQIQALHISDYDFRNERHWLPGEGKIDWTALVDGLDEIGFSGPFHYELSFHGNPKSVARSRDLTPEDIVRNAREIEERAPLTVVGNGGLPDLPDWP